MALRVYSGSGWDSFMGTQSINTTNTNLSTTYQAGVSRTAPSIGTVMTGVVFYIASVPTLGDIQIEIRESGTSKVSGIASNADLQLGFNYIRFATPYVATTTTANAYIPYIKDITNTTGTVARDTASAVPLLGITYTDVSVLGATDDVMIMGFHNSGLTVKTLTLTGTSNSWGSGQNKNLSANTNRVLNCATTIGSGGVLKFDTTANCKLTQYGTIFVGVGGLYDQRPGSSSISTLTFTNDVDGDFALMNGSSAYGGQVLTTGKTVAVAANYASGLGTTVSPLVTQSAHGMNVDDEIVIGFSNTYQKNEVRFIKSIPTATQMILSATKGGAESALVYTHAVGYPICNMTRNSIINNTDTTKGNSVYNTTNSSLICDYSYTRFEYPNCLSGRALQLSSTGHAANIDGMVLYNNSTNSRGSIAWSGNVEQTSRDIIIYNSRGTNFSAQSGFCIVNNNKTILNLYHFADPSSTTNCAALSIAATATSNVVRGLWSSGANASNGGGGYAVGIYGNGNTIENMHIANARQRGLLISAGLQNTIIDSTFGVNGDNVIDIDFTVGTLNQAFFDTCSFGSATLIANYLNMLPGSDIAFQNMDGNTSKHRWYTNNASFWSAGSGLADTTVRTAGSLSLAIKPEDAVVGTSGFILKIPAAPSSRVSMNGYIYRNATYSSGDIYIQLFLPGTLITGTPDDQYLLPATTGSWLNFSVGAYNANTDARYAQVRILAKSATAGAYAFLDDLYDAGTNNKVAGLDLWDAGHVSSVMVVTDFSSAVPVLAAASAVSVWSDTDTYASGTKGYELDNASGGGGATPADIWTYALGSKTAGKRLTDADDNAEFASIK